METIVLILEIGVGIFILIYIWGVLEGRKAGQESREWEKKAGELKRKVEEKRIEHEEVLVSSSDYDLLYCAYLEWMSAEKELREHLKLGIEKGYLLPSE